MNYTAILIDDEIHCTESLRLLLELSHPQIKILATFNHALDARKYLENHSVDLVFLDIEMPDMNGFELLNSLKNINFDVIIVTAYDQYAIKAFTFNAISYLLKPVDEEDLNETIERWKEKNNKTLSHQQIGSLQEFFKNPAKLKTRIALPTSDGLEFLEINTIIRCESESNYTRLYCHNKTKHLICRTLKDVEKVLHENGFIRIHHSHLINPQYIKKFVRHSGGYIVMEDGAEISVSKTKKSHLFDLFNDVERL